MKIGGRNKRICMLVFVLSACAGKEAVVWAAWNHASGLRGAWGIVASRPPVIIAIVKLRKTFPVAKASNIATSGGIMLYQRPMSVSDSEIGAYKAAAVHITTKIITEMAIFMRVFDFSSFSYNK